MHHPAHGLPPDIIYKILRRLYKQPLNQNLKATQIFCLISEGCCRHNEHQILYYYELIVKPIYEKLKAVVVCRGLSELDCERDVVGSLPATFELFSGEPMILKSGECESIEKQQSIYNLN